LLKEVTPDPDRQHPEINAALVLLMPDTEARILATLKEPDTTRDDTTFLQENYAPLVERVVGSTTRGSALRRRAAKYHAQALLNRKIKQLVHKTHQPPGGVDADGAVPAKPRRGRKKKELGA